MPIDPSISDMPWLAQGGYDSRPLAAGAAVGAHVAAQRAQNASLAERAQEFQQEQAAREKQLAVELAQAPLQQTLLQQKAQENALRIEQGLRAKQDDLEADKAWTGLQGAVFDKVNSGDLNGAITEYAKGGIQNPAVLTTDKYKAVGNFLFNTQKEADLVTAQAATAAARMKAAGGAEFRSLPPSMKLQKLLDDANINLADALDPDTGDPTLAAHFQQQVAGIQTQLQMEKDKLTNAQNKTANEAERNKAIQARTASINARTQSLDNRLGGNEKVALSSELRTVDDNSKMTFDEKLDAKHRILQEYELRAKRQVRPLPAGARTAPATAAPATAEPAATNAPTAAKPLRLGTVVTQGGKRFIYQGGDQNDPASYVEARQ